MRRLGVVTDLDSAVRVLVDGLVMQLSPLLRRGALDVVVAALRTGALRSSEHSAAGGAPRSSTPAGRKRARRRGASAGRTHPQAILAVLAKPMTIAEIRDALARERHAINPRVLSMTLYAMQKRGTIVTQGEDRRRATRLDRGRRSRLRERRRARPLRE